MNKEKQIEELTNELVFTSNYGTYNAVANYLVNKGYRKQIEAGLIYEVKHFWDDYGDLRVYVIAHCANCGTPYRENHNVDWERVERPENLDYHADWNIDVEPIKKMVLERAKTIKLIQKYCPNCGAKIKGGAE